MTAPTLPDRHLPTTPVRPAPAAPTRLSAAGWSRLRRSVTTAVFIVATFTGVAIGVHAVDVSPVAPSVASAQVPPAGANQPSAPVVVEPTAPAVIPPPAPVAGGPRPQDGTAGGTGRGGRGGGRR